MTHIVVLGAGLGGTMMAYEMHEKLGDNDKLTVINQGAIYQFVPSNPWVAVRWREKKDVQIDLTDVMARKDIVLETCGAKRVHPDENCVELNDGRKISYDYLIISTGPELAFDEIPGFGPEHYTQSICMADHAERAALEVDKLIENPGPVIIGAAQGASCFGPAYEFGLILDTELRRRKVRDQIPMTFVTSEPYVGHLGLDGVGDTKGLLESELRQRHIKWITNAKIKEVQQGKMFVEELNDDGTHKNDHELPFNFSMILPAFRGVGAVRGIENLTNPRGFIMIDKNQRNMTYRNIFAIGVCVAIPPIGKPAVPVGVPKTGFMIESMVTATAQNIEALMNGKPANYVATWNAVCLADFGDGGVAFFAQPQIPPRNLNWSSKGRWVHYAKIGFEKYFMHKVQVGESMPFYEKFALELMHIQKIKAEKE
ncbi:MAG: FAD/NAD(P)-binding oxidoreductase [Pseudobdellovibrionaceae bacterium]